MQTNNLNQCWNGTMFTFTLNRLASIGGGTFLVPTAYQNVADEPISLLTHLPPTQSTAANGLVVWILSIYESKNYDLYVQHAKAGVVIVSHVKLRDANGTDIPMILMPSYEHVQQLWCAVGSAMKAAIPMPTIAVTGSIGKTTTMRLLEAVFSQKSRVYITGRNRNISSVIVQQMLETYTDEYDYHIQETGGGAPRVVEKSAKLLTPDAFAILNVLPHHLVKYKTTDAIFYDKSSLDRYAKEGAFGVINIDDDMLRNHTFKSRIVTCGIQHKEADYVAENIRQDGIWLKMDIVHGQERVPISINIPGVHNAYNAVVTFAMAKEWNLSNEEIQAGFLAYRSQGIRQNLCEIAGRIMYIDCFNTSVDSIKSALHALDSIEPKAGGRRIAVLGGENALGEQAFSINYEAGLEFAKYHADEFIFVGLPVDSPVEEWDQSGYSYAVYEGARRVVRDRPVSFYDKLDAVADKLVRETKPGDVILFKGHFKLPFWPIIDRAFGTSFTVREPIVKGELWRNRHFNTRYYKSAGGSNIYQCISKDAQVIIPNTVIHKPVSRVGAKVFAGRNDLKNVDFGLSVQNLGAQSFKGCTGLTSLTIPANVIYIESEAFAGCTGLTDVTLEGVLHIERRAFADCHNLKAVHFTDSCQTIENDVFTNCPNVVIVAPQGSIAHQYALDNGISFQIVT